MFLDAQMLHPLRMSDKGSNVRPKWVRQSARFNHQSSDDVWRGLRARSPTRESPPWSSAKRKSPSRSLNLGQQGHQVRLPTRTRDRNGHQARVQAPEEGFGSYRSWLPRLSVRHINREQGYDDSQAHMPRTSTTSQRHRWWSLLWRSARRVRLPPNWSFRDLSGALFAPFLVVLMFTRREGQFGVGEELLSAVSHMQTSDFLRKLLGLSPKQRAMQGGGGLYETHGTVPVEIAQKGLGKA